MSKCTRFEDEGLLLLQQGETLYDHFDTCEDCLEMRAKHERLGELLAEHNSDKTPTSDWETAVLRKVSHNPQSNRQRPWPWLAGLAASVVAFAVFLNVPFQQSSTPEFQIELSDSGAIYRGTSAKPGDQLTLRATAVSKEDHVELRLYRMDGRLIFTCNTEPPCHRTDHSATAVAELSTLGDYRAVLLTSSNPLPVATSDLDSDVLTAREQGAVVVLSNQIVVR